MRAALGRLLSLLPTMFGIAVITFFAIRLIPGDAVDIMLGEQYDKDVARQLRENYGLDRPIWEQFFLWIGGIFRGDLGMSSRSGRPVLNEIIERFPVTLELTICALVVSLLVAIPIGVLSARRRDTTVDFGARVMALLGLSVPNFFLGILLILVFSVYLGWLPSGGYPRADAGIIDHVRYMLMPSVTLGTTMAAVSMRMTRSALLEVLGQDYIRTARAKGLKESMVMYQHALKNALIPVVTIVGIQVGSLLGGSIVIEVIFSLPGLGTKIIQAIMQRDYALIQGLVMFLALFFVVANFVVDLLYIYLNPRIRRG